MLKLIRLGAKSVNAAEIIIGTQSFTDFLFEGIYHIVKIVPLNLKHDKIPEVQNSKLYLIPVIIYIFDIHIFIYIY